MKRIDRRDRLESASDLLAQIPRLTADQKSAAARNVRAKAAAEGWEPGDVLAMLGLEASSSRTRPTPPTETEEGDR